MASNKVQHVIKEGLVHGRYYRVYVTQVNTRGQESERSEPALIRVGDLEAPPVPKLAIDKSRYENGCYATGNGIDVMIKWNDVSKLCDDLARYIRYLWHSKPEGWTKAKAYGKAIGETADMTQIIASGQRKETLHDQPNGEYVYVGLQAVDFSGNASDIYIIRVLAEDTTQLAKPTAIIKAEPYGAWQIRVYIEELPKLSNIRSVIFYRDGATALSPVAFHAGMMAEHIDPLTVMTGLTHRYKYSYVTLDGRESPKSDWSNYATANAIDETLINAKGFEALKKAWKSELEGEYKEAIRKAAEENFKRTTAYADKIAEAAGKRYDEAFESWQVLAGQISLVSAAVDATNDSLTGFQTSFEQDARSIALIAAKDVVDANTGDIIDAARSILNIEPESISLIQANLDGMKEEIEMVQGQIKMAVSKDDLAAEIGLAIENGISTAQIIADRIVLRGDLLLEGDARIKGTLYADDIALVDSETGELFWGTRQGSEPVVKEWKGKAKGELTSFPVSWVESYGNSPYLGKVWPGHVKAFSYTPNPRVNFNGMSSVTITATFNVGMGWHHDYDGPGRNWDGTVPSNFGGLALMISCDFDNGEPPPEGWNPASECCQAGPYHRWTYGTFPAGSKLSPRQTILDKSIEALITETITVKWFGQLPIGEPTKFRLWVANGRISNKKVLPWAEVNYFVDDWTITAEAR